jgi:uncharacterized membrane protein (UPF0127 family)
MHRLFILLAALCALTGCGEKASTMEDISSIDVAFPNGTKVIAQTMRQTLDLTRGLMFRDALKPDHGMLFAYPKDEPHMHWMYQVRFSIDTIWMDRDHNVVEIVRDMPPCTGKAAHECPQYGGKVPSRYVLEVVAGIAAKNGLRVGDRLEF